MSRYDDPRQENCATQPGFGGIGATVQTNTKNAHPSLLNQLYEQRRRCEDMIQRINNTIRMVEGNASIVEVVEAVLAGHEKVSRPDF